MLSKNKNKLKLLGKTASCKRRSSSLLLETIKPANNNILIAETGKVKKIIDKLESLNTPKSTINTTTTSSSSNLNITPKTIKKAVCINNSNSTVQDTIKKLTKVRSSIDKRKNQISSTKLNAKRKSEKQVQAFLKDLQTEKATVLKTPSKIENGFNNTISIKASTPRETNVTSVSPPKQTVVQASKIPLAGGGQSSNLNHQVQVNKPVKDILNNQSILNQYRPMQLRSNLPVANSKNTPLKGEFLLKL